MISIQAEIKGNALSKRCSAVRRLRVLRKLGLRVAVHGGGAGHVYRLPPSELYAGGVISGIAKVADGYPRRCATLLGLAAWNAATTPRLREDLHSRIEKVICPTGGSRGERTSADVSSTESHRVCIGGCGREISTEASWFETAHSRLLTMRV